MKQSTLDKIAREYTPEEVFGEDALHDWAKESDYILKDEAAEYVIDCIHEAEMEQLRYEEELKEDIASRIRIFNLRNDEYIKQPWQFKVDHSTYLGNPFDALKYGREEACNKYKAWFKEVTTAYPPKPWTVKLNAYLEEILSAYIRYEHVDLFCWCMPNRCHAETIKAWLLSFNLFTE